MRYFGIVIVSALALTYYGCSKNLQDKTEDKRVALQVGSSMITLGDLEKRTQNTTFDSAQQEFEAKKNYLDRSLERFLLIEGAREAGLTAELDSSVIKRNILRQYYYKEVTQKVEVSESDAWVFTQHYGARIQPAHLLVSNKKLADSLYEALSKGADFETLVRRFSKDYSTADKGGSMGYTQYGRSPEEFEEAAFGLKIGEISQPVLARFEWHIIKLNDRQDVSKEEFEKNKSQFTNIARQHADRIAQRKFRQRIKDRYHFEVVEPVLDFLAQKADSIKGHNAKLYDLPSSAYLDTTLLTNAEKETYVAKFEGGGLPAGKFMGYLKKFAPERAPDLRESVVMQGILEEIMLPELAVRMAIDEGFDRDPQYLSELEYIRDDALAQKMRDRVYGSIQQVTDEEIVRYYSQHADEFIIPDYIRASGIALKTKQEAEEILQRINNGAVFAQMAMKYSVDKRTGAEGGDLNNFSAQMYTPIYEAAEGLKIGDIGGPVEYDGKWWIFKLTDRVASSPRSLDLVRADLKSKLNSDQAKTAYDEFISRMKEKIKYKMDLDLVKSTLRMGKYQEAVESKG